jgi:SM-20-related protein
MSALAEADYKVDPADVRTDWQVRQLTPGAFVVDNLLGDVERAAVLAFLDEGGWKFGWKSASKTDVYSFWHRHFAGYRRATGGPSSKYPCADELQRVAPFLFELWLKLTPSVFDGHTLFRCYANATSYGSDGTIHTDTKDVKGYTSVYYPHAEWQPNWAGETVLFNDEKSDIVASVYPRPNRLLVFRGDIPHVARGVSRICPVLRVTLMWKTQYDDPSKQEGVHEAEGLHKLPQGI